MPVTIRPFEDRDYERLAEIGSVIDPTYAFTATMLRHRDATMEPRIRFLRLTAELDDAGVVGFGRIMHIWWNFHPHRFQLRVEVEPRCQGRGIGSALYDRLMAEAQAWQPELVRAEAPASNEVAIAFLTRRGFTEWRRRWESVLMVARVDLTPLAPAAAQVAAAGVHLTTYAAEDAANSRSSLARDLYDTEMAIARDEPAMEGGTEMMSFERFCAVELDTPDAIPEGHFLALDGQRIVGVSRLMRDLNNAEIVRQAFTGVHPDYRGRGIAQALKLRTIEYARDHAYREIRTSNDSTNGPMLHINDTLGFKRETPIVIFELRLDGPSDR